MIGERDLPRGALPQVALLVTCVALSAAVSLGVTLGVTKNVSRQARSVAPAPPPAATEECPSFRMLRSDAQLDAAYMLGRTRERERAQELQLSRALRECTEQQLECRHPEGQP